VKKNKILRISIVLNAILCFYLLFFIYRTQEFKNSHNNDVPGGYSYLNNSQYEAYRSMFHLSKRDSIRVVFLGDSITARGCFDEFFEEKSIVNRGIGSDVTEGIFNRVEEIISLNPKQVFIMAGINDISVGVEPEKSADFMKKTCEKIHTKLPDTEIYIESILPTKNVEWKEKIKEL
jgi:hypothetical protein